MKNFLINLLIIITLSGCGFSPIYTKNEMFNFSININDIVGDRIINNLILNQIKRSEDQSSVNKINITLNTVYKKNINSKDATGAAASYELTVTTRLNVINKDNNKNFEFNERFIMDKNDNLLDEKNYERTIKQSFASSIASKIISELNSFK